MSNGGIIALSVRFFGENMKSSYLRASLALACTLALSACGDGNGNLLLGGSVSGINKEGLVLQNNGGSDLAISAPGQFVFKDLVGTDSNYDVTVKSIPSNVEKCEVTNGKGRAAFNILNILVTCTIKTHELKGTVTGLGNASGLVLVNGSDRQAVSAGATSFAMTKVSEDSPYGITILPQPAGLTCHVANGVGKMGTADVTGVQVSCVPSGA